MKVLLLSTVKGIGQKNDIKEVNEGYARNFLLPKGLAKIATTAVINQVTAQKNIKEVSISVQKSLLLKNLKEIEGKTVHMSEKANDTGSLFSSIHAQAITDAIKKEHGITIDSKAIVLDKPIKSCGEFLITISLAGQSVACTLVVENIRK